MSEFRISRPNGGTGLKIVGELDVATAPRLTEALRDLQEGEVVLDLSELTFLDSCGTRALLELARTETERPRRHPRPVSGGCPPLRDHRHRRAPWTGAPPDHAGDCLSPPENCSARRRRRVAPAASGGPRSGGSFSSGSGGFGSVDVWGLARKCG